MSARESEVSPETRRQKGEKRLPAPSSCSPPSDSTPLDSVSAGEPSSSRLLLWPTRMGRTVHRRHAIAELSSKPVFDDPTAPPSSSKKRAYAVWFLAIQLLEFTLIRKQVRMYGVVEVRSEFILHSQLMLSFVYVAIDIVTLINLNVLHPSWGVTRPKHLKGRPILNVTEENSVLARHALKMVARIPNVCGFLLSGRFDIYIGYCLKQVVLMVLSPTFIGVYFAVRSRKGLIKMATANAVFVGMVAYLFPTSFSGEPHMFEALCRTCGSDSYTSTKDLATIGVFIAVVSPFLSFLILSPGLSATTSLDRVPGQGSPVRRSVIGLADDGSSVLESCAVSLRGDEARCIIVQAPLEGTTLRVIFDGRSLPCSTQRLSRAGNDHHTLLTVRAPTHEDPDNSSSSNSAPLVGLAWVVSVQKESSGKSIRLTRSSRHSCTVDEYAGAAIFDEEKVTLVGAGVPLLLVPSADVAEEINAGAVTIRQKLDASKANKFILRMGNCITPATANPEDLTAVLEVTRALGMHLTEQLLMQMHFSERQMVSQVSGASARRGVLDGFDDVTSHDNSEGDVVEGPPQTMITDSRMFRRHLDHLLRSYPEFEARWSMLSFQLESRSWLLIVPHTLLNLLSTCDNCKVSNNVALVFAIVNVAAIGTSMHTTTYHPDRRPLIPMLSSALVCGGLGLLIASATVREGSPDAQLCLIGNIPKLAITLMIILAFSSLNIQLRGNLFLSSLINGVCVLLPSAMVSDDNRWLMFCSSTLRTSFGLLGKCDVNSATDLAVSLATASCMFVVLPWLVAKEVRTLYTSCLLWGGGRPVPAVTAKRKNR